MSMSELKQGEVAVLLGGSSAEREVSLQSGDTVATALASLGYRVRRVDTLEPDWIQQLTGVAFAFNALHGPGGEDGVLQGALTALGIPYSGSRVLGSALAMDKRRSKQLWQGVGLATAGFTMLSDDSDWQAVIQRLGKVFVKPACEGSSIGMGAAANAEELQRAYREAARYGSEVLAEAFIDGPEYTVAVLGDRALPAIRLETDNAFYDYDAKYLSEDTRYLCPCGLTPDEESELAALCLWAFRSLGCQAWGRVDAMRGPDGQFLVLEVNTIPGMTSHSLVPMAAAAAGMAVPDLVERIIALSLEAEN